MLVFELCIQDQRVILFLNYQKCILSVFAEHMEIKAHVDLL